MELHDAVPVQAAMESAVQAIAAEILRSGFASVGAAQMRPLLPQPTAAWNSFAASWDNLGVDTYMADGGRYRHRSFSAFRVSAEAIERKAHQPHYQSRDYNALNGGIERWFQPIPDEVAGGECLRSILRLCFSIFDGLTPEGLHRDGVDWVLVMLVRRENIAEGVTSIHDSDRRLIGRFTLKHPFDSAFVDDSRVYHGVTPVVPVDPEQPAHRDVLVVTLRRE